MKKHDPASQRQIDAARPDRSTWLSANAGSGKTRVLTDRVARLLLDGVDPQHVLCLTYTKAAASEMQNRLFARLGSWAMLPDSELTRALDALGLEGPLTDTALQDARRLFARAIETPGGLKIQTIHSFCASLLRRFPLESGVSPQFSEMEDRTAARLRAEIAEDIAAGPKSPILRDIARHYPGESLEGLTAEIVRHRTAFTDRCDHTALRHSLGLADGQDHESIAAAVFHGHEGPLLERLVPALLESGPNDRDGGGKLACIDTLDITALPVLEDVFLLKSGENAFAPKTPNVTRQPFPTKALRKRLGDLSEELDAWMERVAEAREARLAMATLEKTGALHDFAHLFLSEYDQAKQKKGWLDFDDLILRTRDLLTNPDVAAWVLYRIDGGIDHILVDEAQDTSPVQWQIIERLAQEFTSGQGALSDRHRTIFVVGDKKQSIYSFQGADPDAFDRMQSDFAARLENTGTPLQRMEMEYSFRSAGAILSVVDHTFAGSEGSGFSAAQTHKAFKSTLPGRVDLWPVVPPPPDDDDQPWYSPLDQPAGNAPAITLAHRIADSIAQMIKDGARIPEAPDGSGGWRMRPVAPGDFLILVQRRSVLFHELIRACKARGLSVAGADRLRVGAELAVRDIGALLSFLALPEDSLSLAAALRSPLFGWSEAELYDLAHKRTERHLWPALRAREDAFPETMEILQDLRAQTDYLRPYDLIERILIRHDGRRRLLARLGSEAEDGLDALLSQALAYETQAVDSLTGFLVWMETDELEIKRQMDNAGNRIRVMTVHGAKGLESPVVILPETGQRKLTMDDQIIRGEDGTALWRSASHETPQRVSETIEGMKRARRAERDRLLYVAMTRAEKWLIVAAHGDLGKSGDTWYEKVRTGMEAAGAMQQSFEGGEGLRHEDGHWAGSEIEPGSPETEAYPDLESFYSRSAPAAPARAKTVAPSELGGSKALAGEEGLDDEAAKRRGRQIHKLLEVLPRVSRQEWPSTAASLLERGPDQAEGRELELLLSEVVNVLEKPCLADLFSRDALTEVAVTAPIYDEAMRGHGTIDRLLIRSDHVLAVDFKTNAMVPDRVTDVPDGLLRQMGAYSEMLGAIYPRKSVRTSLLWTRTATLMPLPHDMVRAALREAPPP